MRRDSIGLAWLKYSILATLIILFHTTGKVAGGHGDADDAASCNSSLINRFDALFSEVVSEGCFDIRGLSMETIGALSASVRWMDCNLLDGETLAIIQQDFEMRLCEWRALDSGSDTPTLTNGSQVFVAHTAISRVPPADQVIEEFARSTIEFASEPASELMKSVPMTLGKVFDVATICRTALAASAYGSGKMPLSSPQPVTGLPEMSSVTEELSPAKTTIAVEISAIESAIQVRPWGYRFTRDNLLSSYHFSSELQITKLYDEEYRPYDFFEVPEASNAPELGEVPVVAEVSSVAEMQSVPEVPSVPGANIDTESIVTSQATNKELFFFSFVPMSSITDSIASARAAASATCISAFDQAKMFIDSYEIDIKNMLFERVQQSTPVMNQMAMTATGYAEALAYQHWLTNGIKLAIGWNSQAAGGVNALDEASRAVDPSVVRHDLRKVFGASVLADPFAADCSLIVKRPPMLASPEMVATEGFDSAKNPAVSEPGEGTPSDADGQDAIAYELLVLLQDASWMSDLIDVDFSGDLDSAEIGISRIDEVSAEPKSASLTPENSGIGVSQR